MLMLVAAVALAVPALAQAGQSAWSQAGADPGGTHQATSSGPSDPGLKWISQLGELPATADAPEGFSLNHDKPLVIGADGTIMVHAGAVGQSVGQGNRHLLGIDPADGSLAWNRAYQETSCVPAVDSQGRGWALEQDPDPDGFTGVGEDMLVAFDTATGETIPGATLLPVSGTEPDDINWCRSIALHIGGAGNLERAILFDGRPLLGETDSRHGILAIDISGEAATEAWVLDPEAADAPFGEVVRDLREERIGAFTDDSLLVTTRTAGQLELVELSLADGSVTNRVDLPAYNDDLGTASDSSAVNSATVLVDGNTAVVAVSTNSNGRGALHGVALNGSWAQPTWSEPFDDNPSAQRGPRSLALSGDNVISASGAAVDNLYARNTATGVESSWSGTIDRLRSSAAIGGQYIVGADGTIYATDGSTFRLDRGYSAYSTEGVLQWRFTRTQLLQETGLSDGVDGLNNLFSVRAIDDGVLYLHTEDQLIAIDNSGGLRVPTFADVSMDAPFFEEVEWAVSNGITDGFPDGEFKPTRSVSRQAAIAWLFRWVNPDGDWSEQAAERFSDVSRDSAFANEIGWAVEVGVTDGFPDGEFKPTAEVTRRALAAWFFRLAGAPELAADGIAAYDAFVDIEPNSPFVDEIGWMVANGITTGFADETFRPGNDSSRQASTAFLFRFDQGREDLIQ